MPAKIEFRIDDVDIFGVTVDEIGAHCKTRVDDFVQLKVPSEILRDKASLNCGVTEIQWLDGRGTHQDVREMALLNDANPVGSVARYSACRILREAANVERHLVIEETEAAANYRSIIFKWRPGEAGTRSEILFLRDLLILVTHAEIETQIGKHHPTVLHEPHILTVVHLNSRCGIEHDSLRQRRVGADNVHRPGREVHLIADAVKIE